jgi:hypothetical protein
MPDYAGDEIAQGSSDLGRGLEAMIGGFMQRREQIKQTQATADMLHQMQLEPDRTDPKTGKTIHGATVLDDKNYRAISEFTQRHDYAHSMAAQTAMEIMGGLAVTQAKARIDAEKQGGRANFIIGPDGNYYYRNSKGGLSPVKKSGSTADTAGGKSLTKLLAPYGLEQDDLDNVNELHFLDESGQKITRKQPGTPSRIPFHGHYRGKPISPEEVEKQAVTIKGKTSDGKEFEVPAKKWRLIQQAHKNLKSSSPDRQQAIQILQKNNKPVTEANIQAVIKKLSGQSNGE